MDTARYVLGVLLVVTAGMPALIHVALIEEREVAARFGAEYEKYTAR